MAKGNKNKPDNKGEGPCCHWMKGSENKQAFFNLADCNSAQGNLAVQIRHHRVVIHRLEVQIVKAQSRIGEHDLVFFNIEVTNNVLTRALAEDKQIAARVAIQGIIAEPTDNGVNSLRAVDRIITRTGVDIVHFIVVITAVEIIGINDVVASPSNDLIITTVTVYDIIVFTQVDKVVSFGTIDRIVTFASVDDVTSIGIVRIAVFGRINNVITRTGKIRITQILSKKSL